MLTINPKVLFTPKRLDLIVKYLYAKELLEENENDYCQNVYKDLYVRHILMRTMGVEPKRDYESTAKFSIEDYCENFKQLLFDIKINGYNKNFPIKLDKNKNIENGAHRIAISALLGKDIFYEDNAQQGYDWNFEWFEKNGFNTQDKQRILKGFIDINQEHCAIFVIWNPLFKYIDNVYAVLSKYFDIVGSVELDFEDNYIAFTNALLEIYEPNISNNGGNEAVILEKAKILQANYLNFKVVVVTNQSKNMDKSIDELTKICKEEIRLLFNHILPKECFCTLHSSDSIGECQYLANILLSPNNIKHLKMRLNYSYNNQFIDRVRNLKKFIKTLNINSTNEICCIGSSVMTTLGIQENSDVDFITDYRYREYLGWDVVYLDDDYDIGVSDKLAGRTKNIPDDLQIYNSEYHFWFKGQKFANLDIIKDRKIFSNRRKDVKHVRQINLFEKLIGCRNQQKLLFERIENEKKRRKNAELTKVCVHKEKLKLNFFKRIFILFKIR